MAAEEMFNADQRRYMKYLASLPPEEKCACGWALWGYCFGACFRDRSHGGYVPTVDEEPLDFRPGGHAHDPTMTYCLYCGPLATNQ